MERYRIAVAVLPGTAYKNYLNAFSALGAVCETVGAACDPAAYDGLLLPGGVDMDPAWYGQANVASQDVNRALDELQLGALERFAGEGKPVLGICRGHQVINVAFGGTLVQHLPQSARHDWDEGSSTDKAHPTRAAAGSFLDGLYGRAFPVNSAHHQGVDAPGNDIEVVQWSDDGVVEGIRHRRLPVYGVQWHPERMSFERRRDDTVDGEKLFRFFLDVCAKTDRGRM